MKKSCIRLIALVVLSTMICSCMSCSNSNNNENTDQTAHTHKYGDWMTIMDATCEHEGKMARYCECGDKQEKVIETKEHTYDENGVCTVCGYDKSNPSITEPSIEATSQTLVPATTTNAPAQTADATTTATATSTAKAIATATSTAKATATATSTAKATATATPTAKAIATATSTAKATATATPTAKAIATATSTAKATATATPTAKATATATPTAKAIATATSTAKATATATPTAKATATTTTKATATPTPKVTATPTAKATATPTPKITATPTAKATATPTPKVTATPTPTPVSTPTPIQQLKIGNIKVGSTYTFGSYEQDNNTSNGKEAIEWRVLAIDGNKALLISEYALDAQPYNTEDKDITWETCTLRTWLNNTFLSNAFSTAEQTKIQNSKVKAEDNPKCGTDAGNDTIDKVFLLSESEAEKYFKDDTARLCVPTKYLQKKGVDHDPDGGGNGKITCFWWLRSPGADPIAAAEVFSDGMVYSYGGSVSYANLGVRPALWINLES